MKFRSSIDVPHVRELLLALTGVIPLNDSSWSAECPACGGVGRLIVALSPGGVIRLRCGGGCTAARVLCAVNLPPSALHRVSPAVEDLFTRTAR